MTRLIVVRHAETAFNCENRLQGHLDSCLSAKGLRQARSLARRIFRQFKVDRLYTSDLGRAYSTTSEVVRHTRLRPLREPGLREIHLGRWEGMTPAEVDRLYARGYQRWLKKPSACVIPDGEPIGSFRRRAVTCVRRIARANRGRTVMLVTHGGVITALLADWLGADFDHLLLNLQIDNTSLTIVDEEYPRVRLHTINDASHLKPRDRDEQHHRPRKRP